MNVKYVLSLFSLRWTQGSRIPFFIPNLAIQIILHGIKDVVVLA